MGLRKGQASEAYKQGKMEKYNFRNLPKEKMQEISRKGVEARIEKVRARKEMKRQMEMILGLDIKSNKSKEVLRNMGIEDTEMNNQMLLMVALFKRGLSGDVAAIKEIKETLNIEDSSENQGKAPIINIVGVNPNNVRVSNIVEEDSEDWDDWEDEE